MNTEHCLIVSAIFYNKETKQVVPVLIKDFEDHGCGTSLEIIANQAADQVCYQFGEGFEPIAYESTYEYVEEDEQHENYECSMEMIVTLP